MTGKATTLFLMMFTSTWVYGQGRPDVNLPKPESGKVTDVERNPDGSLKKTTVEFGGEDNNKNGSESSSGKYNGPAKIDISDKSDNSGRSDFSGRAGNSGKPDPPMNARNEERSEKSYYLEGHLDENSGKRGQAKDHIVWESTFVKNLAYDYIEKYSSMAIVIGKEALQDGVLLGSSPYFRMASISAIQVGTSAITGLQLANAIIEAQQGKWGSAVCFSIGFGVAMIPGAALIGPVAGSICSIHLLMIRAYNDKKLNASKK